MELFDSGYTTFNVGGGRCKKCKREVSIKTLPWNPSKEDLTQVWNNDNDPINRLNYLEGKIDQLVALRESLRNKLMMKPWQKQYGIFQVEHLLKDSLMETQVFISEDDSITGAIISKSFKGHDMITRQRRLYDLFRGLESGLKKRLGVMLCYTPEEWELMHEE